jgi:hypothetical protein
VDLAAVLREPEVPYPSIPEPQRHLLVPSSMSSPTCD